MNAVMMSHASIVQIVAANLLEEGLENSDVLHYSMKNIGSFSRPF